MPINSQGHRRGLLESLAVSQLRFQQLGMWEMMHLGEGSHIGYRGGKGPRAQIQHQALV